MQRLHGHREAAGLLGKNRLNIELICLFQQFVWGTFENSYYPTSRKETYYPTVILHDKNYPLKIVDIPDLPFFPVNSFYNLSDLQGEYKIGTYHVSG